MVDKDLTQSVSVIRYIRLTLVKSIVLPLHYIRDFGRFLVNCWYANNNISMNSLLKEEIATTFFFFIFVHDNLCISPTGDNGALEIMLTSM